MPYEDLTDGYTEVDTGGFLARTTPKAAVTLIDRVTECYAYKDYGAGVLGTGDFTYKFEGIYTTLLNAPAWYLFGIAQDIDNAYDLFVGDKNYIFVSYYSRDFFLRVGESGGEINDSSDGELAEGTLYYLTLTLDRYGGAGGFGQAVCTIRTGGHGGAVYDTLSVDFTEANTYRYMYCCNSWNNGTADTGLTGYMQNLDLSGGRRPGRHGFTTRSAFMHRR